MTENDSTEKQGITSPEEPTHEATTPPGNADVDEAAVGQPRHKLAHADGCH